MTRAWLIGSALACCLAAAICWAQDASEAEGLTAAEFRKLHGELAPEKAAWEEVPWRLSVLEACAAAASEKKPVYMLVRSGHPLGCV
jgi:hypothetical protein